MKKIYIIMFLSIALLTKCNIENQNNKFVKLKSLEKIDELVSIFETTKIYKDFVNSFNQDGDWKGKIEIHAPSCRPRDFVNPEDKSHLDIFRNNKLFNIPQDLILFYNDNDNISQNDEEKIDYEHQILQYLRLSNTAEYRFKHLKKIFNGPNNFYWPDRGGYGMSNLLKLKYLYSLKQLPAKKHIYCGYSDLTAMLLYLILQFDMTPIHGPMAFEMFTNDKCPNNFKLLTDMVLKGQRCTIKNLKPINRLAKTKNKATITGKVIGGNLTLLELSIGTAYSVVRYIDREPNIIIFIEDVGEAGYSCQRVGNKFEAPNDKLEPCVFNPKKVKAIIFGEFVTNDNSLQRQIEIFAGTINDIPCFSTNEIGHGYINKPVMLNTTYSILFNENKGYSLFPN